MAIRVAHVGTGNVGRLALTQLVSNPQFELTGVCVSSPEKVGKDAGALAGLDVSTGIAAVNDLDAVLATRPECVVYCAMGDTRLPDAMKDVMRILAAGINVVGSSPGMLQYPWGVMPDKYIARVEDAARQGNSSIFISGVDPGSSMTSSRSRSRAPASGSSRCAAWRSPTTPPTTAPRSCTTWDSAGPSTTRRCCCSRACSASPGARRSVSWRPAWVSSSTRSPSPTNASRRRRTSISRSGHVAKGTMAALQFEIRGMVDGHPAIVVEHITRLRRRPATRLAATRPAGGSYRVEIVGEPSYTWTSAPTSRKGDHNHAAIVGAAGRIVNAIPAVVAAPPGIRTTIDLPLVTGSGLYAPERIAASCRLFAAFRTKSYC